MNPFPVVLSAPSGGGKTTVTQQLLARRTDTLGYSVSCTTRPPRASEVDGVDYHFLSTEEFAKRVAAGEFAEHATVHGNRYGTLKSAVQRVLDTGRHVMMDIDVQGAAQFAVAYPMAVLVFLLPPSVEVLLERLTGRKTESREAIRTRLISARAELQEADRYQYVVVNDALEHTIDRVSAIIDAEGVKRERVIAFDKQVAGLLSRLEGEILEYSKRH